MNDYEYLLSPLDKIKGIGNKTIQLFFKKKIKTIFDLLWHLPISNIETSRTTKFKNLEVGKDKYTALAREIQKHVYRNEYLHVDFIQIDLTKTVDADVQVNFIGTPMGVKEEGGIVQTINSSITISALPTNIPTSLDLDISALNVGDNLAAGDVSLPEGVELADAEDDSILITITVPRAVIEEEEDIEGLEGEEVEGEEGAEGESSEETVEEESSDESGE